MKRPSRLALACSASLLAGWLGLACNSNGLATLDPLGLGCGTLDGDGDTVAAGCDNCPDTPNAAQTDTDFDGVGDACDGDIDNDGVLNNLDNCPFAPNPDQADVDGNGAGDACDPCSLLGDGDRDGFSDGCDNCPDDANADQADGDGDGVGDTCDNCPLDSNGGQENSDLDDVGDACDNCVMANNGTQLDSDGDGLGNVCDNCANVFNPDQADTDGDGRGDVCDAVVRVLRVTISVEGSGAVNGAQLVLGYPAADVSFDCVSGSADCDARVIGPFANAFLFAPNGDTPGEVSLAAADAIGESFAPPAAVFEVDFEFVGDPPLVGDFDILPGSCLISDVVGNTLGAARCAVSGFQVL